VKAIQKKKRGVAEQGGRRKGGLNSSIYSKGGKGRENQEERGGRGGHPGPEAIGKRH